MSALKDESVSIEELKRLQGMRLNALLKEHGKTQKWLAERFGFSQTSVTHWATGKVHMSDYNARLICSEFPGCSPEYLRGYADYPNGITQLIAENWERAHDQDAIGAAVSTLIKHAGFEWTGFKDLQPDVDGFALYQLTRLSDGTVFEVSQGQFDDFSNEIRAYVEMRLNLMIERGRF